MLPIAVAALAIAAQAIATHVVGTASPAQARCLVQRWKAATIASHDTFFWFGRNSFEEYVQAVLITRDDRIRSFVVCTPDDEITMIFCKDTADARRVTHVMRDGSLTPLLVSEFVRWHCERFDVALDYRRLTDTVDA